MAEIIDAEKLKNIKTVAQQGVSVAKESGFFNENAVKVMDKVESVVDKILQMVEKRQKNIEAQSNVTPASNDMRTAPQTMQQPIKNPEVSFNLTQAFQDLSKIAKSNVNNDNLPMDMTLREIIEDESILTAILSNQVQPSIRDFLRKYTQVTI